MALSRVQATPKGTTNSGTLALTFAAPPALGSGIIVIVLNSSNPVTSCSDTYGHTYEAVVTRTQSPSYATIFLCQKVVTTGSPFVVTVTQPNNSTAMAIEVSGATGSLGLGVDRTISNGGSSTAPTTGTTAALRTTADAFVVAAFTTAGQNQTTITVGASSPTWVQELEHLSAAAAVAGEGDSRSVSSASGTTQSASWTVTNSAAWAAVLAAFASTDTIPISDIRVTQAATELLSLPATPALRVTQDAIELLSQPASPALRVTQSVIEILSSPTPSPIVTQFLAETLTHPSPDARASQLVVETITRLVLPAEPHVSQLVVETITLYPPPPPRVSQLVLELATKIPPSPVRVSQTPLELTIQPPAPARLSQSPVEVLEQFAPPLVQARVSQAPVETVQQFSPALVQARVSQSALEIIYPFGCYEPPSPPCVSGEFPIDSEVDTPCINGAFTIDTDIVYGTPSPIPGPGFASAPATATTQRSAAASDDEDCGCS